MQYEPGDKERPAPPRQSTVDLRDRALPRLGIIVDGGVADALGTAFSTLPSPAGGVDVARMTLDQGFDIVIVRRWREYAKSYGDSPTAAIEALVAHGVRQVVALSHRLICPPTDVPSAVESEGLTVGIVQSPTCARLFAAAYATCSRQEAVDGVFVRDDLDAVDVTLVDEGSALRRLGVCCCLLDATTLRSDRASHFSEQSLARILVQLPGAVSPLASCQCVRTSNCDDPSRIR